MPGVPIQKTKYWLPVAFWMAVIFWMSTGTFSAQNTSLIFEPLIRFLLPGISLHSVEVIHGVIRKCGHVSEYFILGILLFRAFRRGSMEAKTLRWVLSALVVVVLYAASDEFHQSFVASRTASVVDVGIDMTGGTVAQLVSVYWLRRARKLVDN
jgi:VanZ family protein